MNLFNEPHSGHPKMRQSAEVEQQIDEKIHQNHVTTQQQLGKETGVIFGKLIK